MHLKDTSMFASVMEKLPPTSYVRMVDVWLIFGQLIPFVEVSLLTIREVYDDENQLINHHGTALEVDTSVSILTLSWAGVPVPPPPHIWPEGYIFYF